MGGDLEGSGRGLSEVLLGGTDRTELCQTRYWAARTEPQWARRNSVRYGQTRTVPDERLGYTVCGHAVLKVACFSRLFSC
jgi:hypothetical protein